MWLKEPCTLNSTITFVGTHDLCSYVVRGEDVLIVGGGMSHGTPALEHQLDGMALDPSRVKYAVVTHSHFDHCGAIPFLRKRFPRLQVLGTPACAEALAKPKVAAYNAKMNDVAAEQAQVLDRCLHLCDCPSALAIDRTVSEGETLDLGRGVAVEFHEVPGHSKCCVATYVPSCKALFPTDTSPQPVASHCDLSFPSAQYDFALYVASLRRLIEFDVDILGMDHYGVLLHEQAREYLRLGLEKTLSFGEEVRRRYAQNPDLDEVSRQFAREGQEKVKLPFITEELMFIITRAMIKSIVSTN
jgi:glyoxylase-like metal-dependent hydrolase (beta-lactamase superfamily II)